MKKIIFDVLKITRIDKYTDKMLEYKWGKSIKEKTYHIIMYFLVTLQIHLKYLQV